MANKKRDKNNNPFEDLVLNDYEKELEESLSSGEWSSVQNREVIKKMFTEAAKRHTELEKSKKVTLRMNQGDLIKLKARAKRKNIPYQTLLNALIRDYVNGKYSIEL